MSDSLRRFLDRESSNSLNGLSSAECGRQTDILVLKNPQGVQLDACDLGFVLQSRTKNNATFGS